MTERALQIGPSFPADIGPTLAEAEIFAEIDSALGFDQTFEQSETTWIASEPVG